MSFRAIQISKTEQGQKADFVTLEESYLMEGDVLVEVSHSSVNYKDGLAITGKGPIIRNVSADPRHRLCRHGARVQPSEMEGGRSGGSQRLGRGRAATMAASPNWRAFQGDWLVPVPKGWTPADCMAVGVAGYTAMLCVMALEEQGVKPADGEVLVTGAAGGVGTTAIVILAHLGYRVIASTGRVSEEPFLKSLGAAGVVDRNEFNSAGEAAGQVALGRLHRLGRIGDAGQCDLADESGGHGGGLRPGAGHGSADHGRALHPARRQAHRRQLGDARPFRAAWRPGRASPAISTSPSSRN